MTGTEALEEPPFVTSTVPLLSVRVAANCTIRESLTGWMELVRLRDWLAARDTELSEGSDVHYREFLFWTRTRRQDPARCRHCADPGFYFIQAGFGEGHGIEAVQAAHVMEAINDDFGAQRVRR